MFATSVPLLPPPSTSLLPPLNDRSGAHDSFGSGSNNASNQNRLNRGRGGAAHHNHPYNSLNYHYHGSHARASPLALLSLDERTIAQRKLAIAMYGHSWLKPAGCTKTMLGRREEEIEREEVERQLREVEMQERNALEVEEQERRGRLEEQARREREGETLDTTGDEDGELERDLDDEVPDMDAFEGADEDEDVEEEVEDDEVDLDDEIPEGDSNWVYDTTRDPDTESAQSEADAHQPPSQLHDPLRSRRQPEATAMMSNQFMTEEERDQAEQEALVNEMLDEDELGGMQRDLDDDMPDMDVDMDGGERDLDDDVPEADADGDSWEHTDTELDESDMDISFLPAAGGAAVSMRGQANMHPPTTSTSSSQRRRQQQHRWPRYSAASEQSVDSAQQTASEMRTVSGNMLPPLSVGGRPVTGISGIPDLPYPATRAPSQRAAATHGRPAQRQRVAQTPGTVGSELSISALISTGHSGSSGGFSSTAHHDTVGNDSATGSRNTRRGWLNPAAARRNLFGGSRNASAGAGISTGTGTSSFSGDPQPPQLRHVSVSAIQGRPQTQTSTSFSSGGLFTPILRNLPDNNLTEENDEQQQLSEGGADLGRRTRDSLEPPSATTSARTRGGAGRAAPARATTRRPRGAALDDT